MLTRAATVVQVLQDLFYVLLHVLFYLWSLLYLRRWLTPSCSRAAATTSVTRRRSRSTLIVARWRQLVLWTARRCHSTDSEWTRVTAECRRLPVRQQSSSTSVMRMTMGLYFCFRALPTARYTYQHGHLSVSDISLYTKIICFTYSSLSVIASQLILILIQFHFNFC